MSARLTRTVQQHAVDSKQGDEALISRAVLVGFPTTVLDAMRLSGRPAMMLCCPVVGARVGLGFGYL